MPEPSSANSAGSPAAPRQQLTLYDSTCIIVGIIVGVGIYQTSPLIAGCLPSPAWLIAMWIVGGLVSLVGALCYAELATTYPHEGGDYVYLSRAFNGKLGFLFAWSQFWIVRSGSVGALAFVFASYANELWPLGSGPLALLTYALAVVVILTAINILGVAEGKWAQNILTTLKVVGLIAVAVAGFFSAPAAAPAPAASSGGDNFRLALILILFTYGGWNEMAYVSAEVRRPEKNILRALILGTVTVTLVYVLMNLAFVHVLGFHGTQTSHAVAADTLKHALGDWSARVISLLICVSALGAINGSIFTGARIFYALGIDHPALRFLGRWHPRFGTPVGALVAQAAVTLGLIVLFGCGAGGFERLVIFTTPVFWGFLLLVGVGLFVLRRRDRHVVRPYRVPGYPVTPLVFCGVCLFMLYSSLSYAWENRGYEALWSLALLAVGAMFAAMAGGKRRTRTGNAADQ